MSTLPDSITMHDEGWSKKIESLSDVHLADSVGDYQLQRADAIAKCVGKSEVYRILDLGCGYGNLMRDLAKRGHEVFGCDISSELISYHQEYSSFGRFELVEPGSVLPYENEFFDIIIASEVVEHVYGVKDFVLALGVCLRGGGQLILTTPYHGFFKTMAIILLGHFNRHFDPEGEHIRFFTPVSLSRILQDLNFTKIKVTGIGRIAMFWKTMLVQAEKK